MIDNFNLLTDFIKPNDELLTPDNFYFLQVIRRSKDSGLSSKTFRDYYIKDSQDLLSRKDEIIDMCNHFQARAYLNVNVKSYERCATLMLSVMADMFKNKSFNSAKGMFTSAAGQVSTRCIRFKKVWIIDYDNGDICQNALIDFLCGDGIRFDSFPTPNGMHFLTSPFDTRNFKYGDKLQKHNPTVLYVP